MGPFKSFFVFMDFNWTLCVLESQYASLSLLKGPYKSLHVFISRFTRALLRTSS